MGGRGSRRTAAIEVRLSRSFALPEIPHMISKLLNLATKYGLPIFAIGLIAFSIRYLAQAKDRIPKVPPPVQPAANPFRNTVAGAGMVEPETENISIGTPLPGIVVEVMVKVGQRVKAG